MTHRQYRALNRLYSALIDTEAAIRDCKRLKTTIPVDVAGVRDDLMCLQRYLKIEEDSHRSNE